MRVGIIGGGVAGLAAGYYLSKKNHEVTVFEAAEKLGGLASSFELGGCHLERFYHHIFRSDQTIINLIDEIGLGDKLLWRKTKMGFFYGDKNYVIDSPLDVLRFSPLSMVDRLKFGFSVLYFEKTRKWEHLETIRADEWFRNNVGGKVFERIWEPLLKFKFGEEYKDVSAAWIWGRVNPRAKSRENGKEKLGYLAGGFQQLVDTLGSKIRENHGTIRMGSLVRELVTQGGKVQGLRTDEGYSAFDKVIVTAPIPALLRFIDGLPEDMVSKLNQIKYQGVVCLILKLEIPLSEIYWMNIIEPSIPFGAVIEHTNFVDPKWYNGSRIVYLPNYLPDGHRYFSLSKNELLAEYYPSLKRIFPQFDTKSIDTYYLFKTKYATPIYALNYSARRPDILTPIEGLFMVNTSQIYPEDRNMNNSIKLGIEATEILCSGLHAKTPAFSVSEKFGSYSGYP